MNMHLPDIQSSKPLGKTSRFSDFVGSLPYTVATLPAQLVISVWLLKLLTSVHISSDATTSELAQFTPQSSLLASILLLVMLLGVSAFLIHRLRRILHNANNPTLKDVIHVRSLEVKRYRKMLSKAEHLAGAGSWFSETKSGHLIWSDELFRIFGFEPTEFAPDKEIRLGLVHPDDRKMFVEHELKSISSGQAYKIRMRIMRPSGSYRVIQHNVEPEFDSKGNLVRRIGTVVDITHQVENENTFRMMF
ncbi:MAG TPA: hypothetical protein ENH10_04775, partial [Bacteroidetes bacterium]|nr:hypothetical protein [Bacteroidota bacterium]HEX04455.1 hypothetical protein [Bacteroidota bacterium]